MTPASGVLWDNERSANSIRELENSIVSVSREVDEAETALLEAGIAAVGSLSNRIRRLAAERDEWVVRLTERWVYEDELQCEITPELFAKSRIVCGVRMYPGEIRNQQ